MTSHSLLLKTALLKLLYFAHNMYLSVGDERSHKYFYCILIPGVMYVHPSYFETIAEMFNADDPHRWDMHSTASPWFSDLLEFEAHLFHLISRLVSTDYAKHYNARVQFLQEEAPWHYQYADETHDLTSLFTKYGLLSLVLAFFMRLGVVHRAEEMKTLLQNFYHNIYNGICDPPHPDMRMLMYHSVMSMMKMKFKGRIWDFAHFLDTCATDICGMTIYVAAKSMLYTKLEWVMGVLDKMITQKFVNKIV